MDQRALWATFRVHLANLFREAPGLRTAHDATWFAVLSGEYHPDLNQAVLQSEASGKDAEDLLAVIAEADVPAVVSVASTAEQTATAPLLRAGMITAPLPEPLMWCGAPVSPFSSGFEVRSVESERDLQAAHQVCAEGHAIDLTVVSRVLARDLGPHSDVSTWIAWDGTEPVSVVWLTHGEEIGVWEMMTPPQHRRRGAARAALTVALSETWTRSTNGAFLWASPVGRRLYESLGFEPLDEPTIWFSPGQDAAAAAIGQAT